MVVALFILGVSSIREFAAPLMVGIGCGAYTSVCITGALWYVMKTKIGAGAKAAAKAALLQEAGNGSQKAVTQNNDNASETSGETRKRNTKSGKSKKKKKKNRR